MADYLITTGGQKVNITVDSSDNINLPAGAEFKIDGISAARRTVNMCLGLNTLSSQYASIADGSQTGLDLAGSFTIEAWIYPLSVSGSDSIVTKYDSGSSQRAYQLDLNSGVIRGIVSSDGTLTAGQTKSYTGDTTLTANGGWYHVAFSFDIDTEEGIIYLNGAEDGSTNVSGTGVGAALHNSSAAFAIGAQYSTGSAINFFDGNIKDVRVWSDVRTPAEIAANFRYELVGNEAGLVSYWKLNNDALDETTTNNDLTLQNSAVFRGSSPF